MEWAGINGNFFCGVFLLIGATLLIVPLPEKTARLSWIALALIVITFDVAFSLLPINLVNINVAQYYLGAKYPIPYSDVYRAYNAALERPQTGMRDLDDPTKAVREDDREIRAYYLDLLRANNLSFSPTAPTTELQRLAVEGGAVRREANQILKSTLPEKQIAAFRADALTMSQQISWGRDLTADYGFNGSPFYAAVRHLDPTLYFPFGSGTAILNLVFQIVGSLAIVWILGLALGCTTNQQLAMTVLLFSSWDFVGYALPGLVFAGLWLPVAVAVWATARRRPLVAGSAIAWASLLKLFPAVLLLPTVARILRSLWQKIRHLAPDNIRWAMQSVFAAAIAGALFWLFSMLSGRSWPDFFGKIANQFENNTYSLNDVSLNSFLLTLGISNSILPALLAVIPLGAVIALLVAEDSDQFARALPRRMLVLLSLGALIFHVWLNYYVIVPIMLIPIVSQRRRWFAAAAAGAMALAFFLPEFDDPQLQARPILATLKLAPYLLLPASLLVIELIDSPVARKIKQVLVAAVCVAIVIIAADTWRMSEIRKFDVDGSRFLDNGQGNEAALAYQGLISLEPDNAMAHMNAGIGMIMAGKTKEAETYFATAVNLDSNSVDARQNYGRLLQQIGRIDDSKRQIQAALTLQPFNNELLYDLARICIRQNRLPEAITLLRRAQELAPGDEAVCDLLAQLSHPATPDH